MSLRTKMRITKLRLINWHYFNNYTIEFKDSNLFSGDNGAGKSTILDAIQMLLTTNIHKFNQAANSNSKRNLKTYVRGKTGEEGSEFLRKGAVISYAALEIYEESKNRSFVLGVMMESPDQESDVKRRWFCEEGALDQLSFVVNNKPATDKEFQNSGRKISFMHTEKEAKNRFGHRLGHLQDSFFELLPRSIAFKPMENVKAFVSQFILPKRDVEIYALQENINSLNEMQGVVEQIKQQVHQLSQIQDTYNEILSIDRNVLVIDILIKLAEYGACCEKAEELKKTIVINKQLSLQLQAEKASLETEHSELNAKYVDVLSALKNGENAALINRVEAEINSATKDRKAAENSLMKLKDQVARIKKAQGAIAERYRISEHQIDSLEMDDTDSESRNRILFDIKSNFDNAKADIDSERIDNNSKKLKVEADLKALSADIKALEQNRITYNANVYTLKKIIESEFLGRGIKSSVYVLADLLEITDKRWQNAVEGYLNTQRFYLIVEPQYYDIAAQAYDRNKASVHSAAVVNTAKLNIDITIDENSLASVVYSENRYAKAFICYLLNKVKMCDKVTDLKQFDTSITCECMLYQGKALRRINPDIYKMPYIGKYALQKQLEIKKAEYAKRKCEKAELGKLINYAEKAISFINNCNFETMAEVIVAPTQLKKIKEKLIDLNRELKEAENDPTYLQLKDKVASLGKSVSDVEKIKDSKVRKIAGIDAGIEADSKELERLETKAAEFKTEINQKSQGNDDVFSEAQKKYNENKKSKSADTISINYQPRRAALQKNRESKITALLFEQSKYKDGDIGTGIEAMNAYFDEYSELTKHDLIKYEEKLKNIRDNCEIEFRESFLVKMRENIEKARDLFKELNKTLKPIYYGNDSYQFSCVPDNNKRKLYDMITSNINLGDYNLFSAQFDEEYHDEMEELFSKLTASDEKGADVIREYTDYRSYMDYDIDIISKDGRSQKFSRIYREKSGGETQTPYYVAIAASFAQIYNTGETIRVIMLDEAFDKMDEERIKSMMDFFKTQDFQIILAAPTTRLELIGEQTDQIVMVYSDKDHFGYTEAFSYDEL